MRNLRVHRIAHRVDGPDAALVQGVGSLGEGVQLRLRHAKTRCVCRDLGVGPPAAVGAASERHPTLVEPVRVDRACIIHTVFSAPQRDDSGNFVRKVCGAPSDGCECMSDAPKKTAENAPAAAWAQSSATVVFSQYSVA